MKRRIIKGLAMTMVMVNLITGCGREVISSKEMQKSVEAELPDEADDKNIENMQEPTVISDEIYTTYVGWTEAGLTHINLPEYSEWVMASYECDKDTLMMKEKEIEKYNGISMRGNNVILEKEDGTELVLEYDAEAEMLMADGYCFYGNNREFTEKELKNPDCKIDATYTATLEGEYSIGIKQYARDTYTVEAKFSADGTVTGIIRGEKYFMYHYYIKDDTILYIDEDGDYQVGYYDKENNVVTMNLDELEFK